MIPHKVKLFISICILALALDVDVDAAVADFPNEVQVHGLEPESITLPPTIIGDGEEDATKSKEPKPFLLPQALKPIHYRLEIIPLLFEAPDESYSHYKNASKFSAPGKVWIRLKCLEDTSNVTLHAHKDVRIVEETITVTNSKTNETIPIRNVSRQNDTDFLILHLSKNVTKNSNEFYILYIEFISKLADDRLNGIYLDYYIDPESKKKRYLSTTLFAPHHARKAFPCFDEPGFKTNFSIKIGRKNNSGYNSISNMPLLATKPLTEITGWVWDVFEDTLPLPTYLVALITTDFSFRSVHHGDVEVRLHAPDFLLKRTTQLNLTKNNVLDKNQNPYLLQDPLLFIESALEMWKDTGLGRYPLPKLDVIALPHFFFNAMENMGAMTFKYPVILNVENTTTTSELLRMNFVAGHEVVHQWFGNMLTPKSWTYVWLKESFSDLFARIFLSEKLNNEYRTEDLVINELQKALEFDSGPDTHPLENHIKSSASIAEIYTAIPYKKGASVMHMTRFFMGAKPFRRGLESLFLEKKYSNIDQYDLFNHLDQVQKMDKILASQDLHDNISVTDILNTWTKQSGYPVVRVQREASRLILKQEQYENGLLKLLKEDEKEEEMTTTEKYVGNDEVEMKDEKEGELSTTDKSVGNDEDEMTDEQQKYWWIPVKICNAASNVVPSNTEHYQRVRWMPPNDTEVVILDGSHHHVSNVEGYFRILYSKEELLKILKDVTRPYHSDNFRPFSYNGQQTSSSYRPVEISQLLDDYFCFAFSKYEEVPISTLFHIMSTTLPYEGNYVVWKTVLNNMQKPYQLLQNTEYFPSFQKFLTNLLRPLHSFLQSQSNSILTAPCSYAPAVTRRMNFSQFSALVFKWLCRLGAEECLVTSNEMSRKFMETGVISTKYNDNQQSIFCTAIKAASDTQLETSWAIFQNLYFEESYSVQRDRYLKALSCTTKPEYLERMLAWTTNTTLDFHDVDRVTLIKYVIANPKGRELILDFLDRNFDSLYKSASVANPVTEGLKAFVDYVNSDEKLKKVESFIEKHSSALEQKKRSLKKQVRTAKLNIIWMEAFAAEIGKSAEYNLKKTLDACSQGSDPDFESYLTRITDW